MGEVKPSNPRKKLKIGLVLDDTLDTPDGVQQYVVGLGEWLRSQGHQVGYIVGKTHRNDLRGIHSMSRNMRVKFNGNRLSIPLPTSTKAIKKLLAQEQFDVLHVQMPYSPFMAHKVVLAAPQSTAVFGTFHILPIGKMSSYGTKALGIWLHRSKKRFDAFFSVSKAAQSFAKKSFGIESTVSPNVFDYALFHTANPFKIYDDKTKTILFLGRLVPRKGCKTLLEAAAILRSDPSVTDFRVVVCGKGPLKPELETFVAQNNLTDCVTFTGFVSVEDKPRYYASSDISVFPSSGGESFGIVLLEAMASGNAAVLAGDNAGYASVMEDNPALLFPATDVAVLAERIKELLLNEAKRKDFAAWGAAYTKRFDTNVVGEDLLAQYEAALRSRLVA